MSNSSTRLRCRNGSPHFSFTYQLTPTPTLGGCIPRTSVKRGFPGHPYPPFAHPGSYTLIQTNGRSLEQYQLINISRRRVPPGAFTKDGTRVIVVNRQVIATINLETLETKVIVPDVGYRPGGSSGIEVGAISGDVYNFKDHTLYSVNTDTLARRTLVTLAEGNNMSDINADETLLFGTFTQPDPDRTRANTWPPPGTVMHASDGRVFTFAEMREVLINQRLEQRVPKKPFTVDLKFGARTVIHETTNWLGHVQCSPTDPSLIMFCHEGNWHKVARIWTIRTDGSDRTKIHTRTMNMEIAGHEFMSPDGATIWHDLQTRAAKTFGSPATISPTVAAAGITLGATNGPSILMFRPTARSSPATVETPRWSRMRPTANTSTFTAPAVFPT